jgi:predicted nucleotidyltransferase
VGGLRRVLPRVRQAVEDRAGGGDREGGEGCQTHILAMGSWPIPWNCDTRQNWQFFWGVSANRVGQLCGQRCLPMMSYPRKKNSMQSAPYHTEQIQSALSILHRRLGDALLGVYLHGSAVSGGLQPESDIDLLAVTESKLTANQRNGLWMDLLRFPGRHPAVPGGARCLEVMVFRQSDLANGDYLARVEFVYGEWLREGFEAGERSMPERDPEYSLVIAQAHQEAFPLFGPPREALLPEISADHVKQAMRDVLPDLLDGLPGDERNVLLTLARMWHTACTGKFVTKDAAAEWAIPLLSSSDAMALDHARRAYLGEVTDDWNIQGEAARELARRISENVTNSL